MTATGPSPRSTDVDGPDLASYLRWLRRHWLPIAGGVVVGLLVGVVVLSARMPVFQATTQVVVRPTDVSKDGGNGFKVNLDTEAQVVRALVVAERARAALRIDEPAEQLARNVVVTVPPNSQVLDISYTDSTPERAQAGSRAFAAAYLDLRGADARRRLADERKVIDDQISSVTRKLDALTKRIAAMREGSTAYALAISDRDALGRQLGALNERRSPLVAAAVHPGEVISAAGLPTEPTSPRYPMYLGSGAALGLLAGLGAATGLARRDSVVRTRRDLTDRFAARILLDAPGQISAVGMLGPSHGLALEMARLRNVLLTATDREGSRGRVVLVVGATPGHTATFIAANLAAAYARAGHQVVGAGTVPGSALAAVTGVGPVSAGLAEVLRRDVGCLTALVAVPDVPALRVLLPGDLPPGIDLPITEVRQVLEQLADRFDQVVVEAASPLAGAEAQVLAGHADALLVVVEAGRTTHREVARVIERFAQVGVSVTGLVLAPTVPAAPGVAALPTGQTAGAISPGPMAVPRAESTVVLPRVLDLPASRAPGGMTNSRESLRRPAEDPRTGQP